MVDLHSHILPNIEADDGSRSLDMSLDMLKMAAYAGTTDIFATPHVNRQGVIAPWPTIIEHVKRLQQAADQSAIPIRIHTGAEVALDYSVLQLITAGNRAYCLSGSAYILVELTGQSQPDQVEALLYELMLREIAVRWVSPACRTGMRYGMARITRPLPRHLSSGCIDYTGPSFYIPDKYIYLTERNASCILSQYADYEGGGTMLDDVIRKGRLLDIYGSLLTERQRRCMELYFDMDWSLSEIGEELEISRQGVYDMLSRASKSLESYEQRLRLLARSDAVRSQLDHAGRLLEQGGPAQIEQAKKIIQEIEI